MKVMSQIQNLLKEKENTLSINDFRVIIAFERVVARLEADSFLAKHLVFKGGFVLLKHDETQRFTRDIDATTGEIDRKKLIKSVSKALQEDLNDGLSRY